MTSRKYVIQLFLTVFLIMINLSKEGCYNYFNVNKWKDDLNKTFPLVITNDFKDTIECTLEKKYKQDNHKRIRDLLNDCFYRHGDFNKLIRTGKCTGETQNISFYNFMWLMGKAVDYTKGSDLDTVCQVYKTSPHTETTKVLPPTRPTTAATTTTATTAARAVTTVSPPTTTVLPPTTTTTKLLQPTTTRTTVLPPTTTTTTLLPPTTTTTTTLLPPPPTTTTVLPPTTTTTTKLLQPTTTRTTVLPPTTTTTTVLPPTTTTTTQLLQPTTTRTTVLPPTTTTTLLPPTTTTTTLLPPLPTTTTTTTTVLPPTTTATIASLAPTASKLACLNKGSNVADPETSPNKFRVILMLLVLSLICNMALLLVVYRYRRRQSRWDRNQWNPTHGSDENLPGHEEFQSLCVTQPPQCDFVLTHSAVVNGNSADAEEGTQL